MCVEELMVRSSIQLFLADPNLPKPVAFGSGCLIMHRERQFLISVAHVTNLDGLITHLETNLPSSEEGTPIQPIGGLCYFDLLKITSNMNANEFETLLEKSGEPLDITFTEIKQPLTLIQPELDFGAFKVEEGYKVILSFDDLAVPDKDKTYGFYGKVRHGYSGKYLKMQPTLKNNLKFHRTHGHFHMFLAPDIITDVEDYEGCSGAPILDSEGRIVALACKIMKESKIIYGFSIQECKKLLNVALDTGML